MKSDAASLGVEDRIGQQVVDVDDHHREHPPPRRPPSRAEGQSSHHARRGDVKGEVGYGAGIHRVVWLSRGSPAGFRRYGPVRE